MIFVISDRAFLFFLIVMVLNRILMLPGRVCVMFAISDRAFVVLAISNRILVILDRVFCDFCKCWIGPLGF